MDEPNSVLCDGVWQEVLDMSLRTTTGYHQDLGFQVYAFTIKMHGLRVLPSSVVQPASKEIDRQSLISQSP